MSQSHRLFEIFSKFVNLNITITHRDIVNTFPSIDLIDAKHVKNSLEDDFIKHSAQASVYFLDS
jgi:hypothetical protein